MGVAMTHQTHSISFFGGLSVAYEMSPDRTTASNGLVTCACVSASATAQPSGTIVP